MNNEVTAVVELRRKYQIVEGMKMTVEDTPTGIVFRVIPKIKDLADIDAGKMSLKKAYAMIDKTRSDDRN
ncbi:MAG: hypothetical protein GX638_16175 [Crenarchaeota archaeon]|nr:hypothetical protein [Thermoproteota archaeon]